MDPSVYKQIFERAPVSQLLVGIDADFTVLDASDSYLQATGTRREAIVGRSLLESSIDPPGLRASLQRVLATGCAEAMEEGSRRRVSAPVFSADGSIECIIQRLEAASCWVPPTIEFVPLTTASIRHASVPTHDDQTRAEMQRVLSTLIDTTPECVKLVARDGTVLRMNPSGLAMVGAATEEVVVGRSVYDLIAPEHREAFRTFNERVCGGEKDSIEFDMIGLCGTRRHMDTHAAPLPMPDGSIVQLAFTRDVTARRSVEQALRESDRRKDEFIATLSHELRNPLAPLRNALNLLHLPEQDEPAPVYRMMERQLNHMVRLVDDLLEVSRISRGVLELRRERIELATIVRNALETCEPLIRERRHRLEINLPGQSAWLDGDPVRLAQIFSSLLNNAARFTDSGGCITLDTEITGDEILVRIRDTGRGFAPDSADRIFQMFTRSDRSGGLGIGLTLSRRLAELHGGEVQGSSEGEGRGALFCVRLPRAAVPQPSDADQAAASDRIEARYEGCRVLIADDNRDAADSLGELLRALGSDVSIAYDGAEAVELARSFRPDLALLDLGMPKLSGYDAARRIRLESGTHPLTLVALSGWGREDDRRRTCEAGFDQHLVKPAELAALRVLLAAATPSTRRA